MSLSWHVSPAGASDIPGVIALYREAQEWLQGQGFDQWQGQPQVADRIRRDVDKAAGVWVIRDCASRLVATIKLDERADPEFWRPEDEPRTALYAHRGIVIRSHAGLGLGSAMLNWASLRAEAAGKKWLRFDSWATNTKLHALHQSQGFTLVRILRLPHRGSGALFQRAAGVTHAAGPRLKLSSSPATNPAEGQ